MGFGIQHVDIHDDLASCNDYRVQRGQSERCRVPKYWRGQRGLTRGYTCTASYAMDPVLPNGPKILMLPACRF
jgi:hypothetical protein